MVRRRCFRLFHHFQYFGFQTTFGFALFVWALAWLFCSIKCDLLLKFLLY
jgi:hypothetical protein